MQIKNLGEKKISNLNLEECKISHNSKQKLIKEQWNDTKIITTKSWFCENLNKSHKLLAQLVKQTNKKQKWTEKHYNRHQRRTEQNKEMFLKHVLH